MSDNASKETSLGGRAARGCALVLLATLISGCAVKAPLTGNFLDDSADSRAVAEATRAENKSEPSLGERLASIWDKATTSSSSDDALEVVAPAESFTPRQAMEMVNRYREQNGLHPVALHPKLQEAARLHAQDLADNDRISHFGSDGSDPWERVQRTGFNPKLAAENVATGQKTFGEVFRDWKRSPDHNRNLLLPDATHMGVAVIEKPNTQFRTFWSMVLGTPN